MKPYLFTFCLSLLMCMTLMPLVILFARRFQLVDKPSARKVHRTPVPRVGGIAIAVAALLVSVFVFYSFQALRDMFKTLPLQTIALLGTSAFIFGIGLLDDKFELSGKTKFLAIFIAACVLCASGFCIRTLNVGKLFTLELGQLSWPVTVLWITGVSAGLGFVDGLDGLAASLSAIAALVIMILAFYVGQPVVAVIMLALLGALVGFLLFNYNPAKLFMGDCGSLFLGFILSASVVALVSTHQSIETFGIAAVALGVPILDAGCTMIRRGILERRSIFNAERGHIHHRLLDMGLSQKQVVVVLCLATLLTSAMAMFTLATKNVQTVIILLCILLLYLLFFRVIGSVSISKTLSALQRNKALKQTENQYKTLFEDIQLQLRRADTFDQWWILIRKAAIRLNFQGISMDVTNRDGSIRTLAWQRKSDRFSSHGTTSLTLPVRDRRSGPPLKLTATVNLGLSLETTGARITFFMRMLDEHSVGELENK